MKYCKDCKYFVDYFYSSGPDCKHPTLMTHDVLWGPQNSKARTNRKDEALCGKDAKYYEQKSKIATTSWFLWRQHTER